MHRLPSAGFLNWSRFLAVSLQVMWVISLAVGCHYFPPGLQLPSQPLRRLLPILLLGEQRHNGCEQSAQDCYRTASRLRFEPGTFCAWVQHANHSPTEPPMWLIWNHFYTPSLPTHWSCISTLSRSIATQSSLLHQCITINLTCCSVSPSLL